MRVVNVVLGLSVVCLVVPAFAAGCGSDTTPPQTSTGSCAPTGACAAVKSDCVALADNAGKKTGIDLRMSQLTLTSPAALLDVTVKKLITNAVLPLLPDCNIDGQGTFNWLLQFDFTAGTLKTGGAKPVADPQSGYCFVTDTVMQNGKPIALGPVTLTNVLKAPGSFDVMTPADLLNVPIYLDPGATMVVILPLRKARIHGTVLSADGNCVGKYNGDEFTTTNLCLPDVTTMPPQQYFTDGGTLDGYITLEDADGVSVQTLGESLCVLLSKGTADPNKYTTCPRDAANKIMATGDWCSTSDTAATPTCADAFRLGATFAAAGIKINDTCP